MCWICAPAPSLLSPIRALQGDTGWRFQVDCLGLVMDLQVGGNALCHFLPLCSPLTPSTASPSFHSRLHNHCTAHKGLSSQVQPRLARIKERFQLKMFFPSLFFFPQPAPSLSFLVFPFLLMSSNSFFCSYLLHTVHLCFIHTVLFPSPYIFFLSKQAVLKWKNKSL